MSLRWVVLAISVAACDGPMPIDAGRDAGVDAAFDGGRDAGMPPTGCHLSGVDAGLGDAGPLPAPGDFVPPVGPGAPAVPFDDAELGSACAYLPVGPTDE